MINTSIFSRITVPGFGPRALGLLGALLVTFSLLTVPSTNVDAAEAGLELSQLEYPEGTTYGNVGGIDMKNRRLYVFVMDTSMVYRIAVYDLRPDVPKLLQVSAPGVTNASLFSPFLVNIDGDRGRMHVISTRETGNRSKIDVIDLNTLQLTDTWDLATRVPGFMASGMTYDKATNRLYLVGDFTVSSNLGAVYKSFGMSQVPQGAAVAAVDADTGELVWLNLMPKCDSVLKGATTGAMVAQSKRRPALYAFCMGGYTALQPTGQNGLIRMDISGHETTSGLAQFPMEFFPISGSYYENGTKTGLSAFDPDSERFFAQSLASRTPGTWVFDGLRDSWVGFIAAPDNKNEFYGLNTTDGRYYMGGNGGYIEDSYVTVSDGRSTPVAQGSVFDGIYLQGQLIADPATNRIFAPSITPGPKNEHNSHEPIYGLMMLRDTTLPIRELPDVDLDKFTRDLPDSKAAMQYSAGASGFGARYTMIGGWESAWERLRFLNNADNPAGNNPGGVAYGDRGLTFAAAPAVDIRPAGASATAAGGSIDQATRSDRQDRTPEPAKGAELPVTTLADGLTCLDGAGERQEHKVGQGDPERVAVVCDLEKLTASASTSFTADINGGGQSLASSSFDTRTFRDPKLGVVTETTTVARGISLRDPSGRGSIEIERVTAVAKTVANGRPGSTQAVWERTVEDAVITHNGDAQRPRSCTTTITAGRKEQSSGDCADLQRALNSLSSRLQVRFPMPRLTATPRGAFARVEEQETDYLNSLTTNNDASRAIPAMEVLLYNDGPEKGRLLVQRAAIDANATFVRSLLSDPMFPTQPVTKVDTGDGDGGNDTSTTTRGSNGGAGTGAAAATTGAQGTVDGADSGFASDVAEGALAADAATTVGALSTPGGETGVAPVMGWLIGARNPREAAMAVGIWLLFAGALMGAWRRRRLIETVGS